MRSSLPRPIFKSVSESAAAAAVPVWIDETGQGRNVYVVFEQTIALYDLPPTADFHLFASTRYRLTLNGQVIAYGPSRFVRDFPEYDTIDLLPHLQVGENRLAVLVLHHGAPSFEAEPCPAGFIAWGRIGRHALGTPGKWRCTPLQSHDPWAPEFSFAQAPVEIADLRASAAPVIGAIDSKPRRMKAHRWDNLSPRSIALPTLHLIRPKKILRCAPLIRSEQRIGYRVHADHAAAKSQPHPRTCYATWIHSPSAQAVQIGAFWGPNYLNGDELRPIHGNWDGNRVDVTAPLRSGWNLLYGEPEMLSQVWGVLIGLPTGKGLIVSAEPAIDCPDVLKWSSPIAPKALAAARPGVPGTLEQLDALDLKWNRVRRGERVAFPSREMAWDRAAPAACEIPTAPGAIELPADTDSVLLYDLGSESIGHVRVEIDAPEGTVLDIGYGEWLRDDGLIAFYSGHWGINAADRFILPGGREVIETFHPRGGRYVQLAVRDAGDRVTIHDLAVRVHTLPLKAVGRFECSDAVMNWTWTASVETIHASLEDGWVDPHRERGMYLGDSFVESHAHRLITADESIPRHCLRLFARSQRRDGHVPDVAPAWETHPPLADYTFIWLIWLYDYWATTGDVNLVRELWPHVERIFAGPCGGKPCGLLSADSVGVFIDWGATPESKTGQNAVLNALAYAAVTRAATLADEIGQTDRAVAYRLYAARLKREFARLWDERHHRFAAAIVGSKRVETDSLHANVLALLYGLAEPHQWRPALQYVLDGIPKTLTGESGRMELYFHFYLLDLLHLSGETETAEHVIRSVYGRMKCTGATTLWETLYNGLRGRESICHGWSTGPMKTLAERTLGLTQARAGDVNHWILRPTAKSVTFARGAVPHRLGPIEAAWRREGDALLIDARAPEGVRVEIDPGPGIIWQMASLLDGRQLEK